jgi:hypothetical protein
MPPLPLSFLASNAQQQDPERDLVSELLSSIQPPEEPGAPKKPGLARRIFGTLGDALVAAGGGPSPGPFTSTLLRRQEEYRLAYGRYVDERRELANDVALFRAKIAQADEDRRVADISKLSAEGRQNKALSDRQAEQDRRIAARQEQDDQRNAAQKEAEWKRKVAIDLATQGINVGDPSRMTVPELIDRIAAVGGKELTPQERLAKQEEAALAVDPDMKRQRITFTGADGKANSVFALRPEVFLSSSAMAAAERVGVPIFDAEGNVRSRSDISADVTATRAEEREQIMAARSARLSKIVNEERGLSGTLENKLIEQLGLLQDAQGTLTLLTGTTARPGGPIANWVPDNLRYTFLEVFGQGRSAEINREVTIKINKIFNVVAKIRSGAAVTKPEELRLRPELPVMSDTNKTMKTKLRLLIEDLTQSISLIQSNEKLEPGDIQSVADGLADPQFIPTELESGDLLILGGDR